jgi:prohibitin 1
MMEVRDLPRVISTSTGTKDMQMINISMRLLYRPDETKLTEIYKTLGVDFGERILPSIGNEILKTVVAQYNAEQLLTERDKVSGDIRQEMITRAKDFNIFLDDVSITHLTFGPEFTAAIESKQVAQQMMEREKFVVLKSEQEMKAQVILAEGEAEAAQLISDSLKASGRGVIEVRRIDAARDIAETLARSRNVTYLPSGGNGGPQMLLNVGGGQQ